MASPSASALDELSGARKTAILFVLLGEDVASRLLQHLSKREVARIAKEIAELGTIDPQLAEAVLQDYYLTALKSPAERGGADLARKLLAQAEIPVSLMDQLLGPELRPGEEALGPLLETKPELLARALQEEHPQTAALVLLHLPVERAGEVLAAMPEDAQSETILRMATLKTVRGEVLGEVASSLHERLDAAGSDREETDGMERTASLLLKLARADMKRLLDALEPDHPEEVEQLRSRIFTFDSLILVDDVGMQSLLRQVDTQKLALALKDASAELSERFLGNLSERAASMLREEMEFLTQVAPNEQEAVRKEIIDLAIKLEAEGTLSFSAG